MKINQNKKLTIAFTTLFIIVLLCAAWFTTAFVVRHKMLNLNLHFITKGIHWQPVESVKITGFPFNFVIALKDQKVGIQVNDKKIDLQFPEVKIQSNLFLTKNEINWGKQFIAIHQENNVLMSSSDHIKMQVNFSASPFFNHIKNLADLHNMISLYNLKIENFNFTFNEIKDVIFEKIDLKINDGKIENQKTKKIFLDMVAKQGFWNLTSNLEYYKKDDLLKFALYDLTNKTTESNFSIKGKGSIDGNYESTGDFSIEINNIEKIASDLISLDDLYKSYPTSKNVIQNILQIIAKIEKNTQGRIIIHFSSNNFNINEMSLDNFVESIPDLEKDIEQLKQSIIENFSTLSNMNDNINITDND